MTNLEERLKWLKEILDEKPQRFADYYKEDIANYLDIENLEEESLEDLLNNKFAKFNRCKTKVEIQKFVNDITSYVVMKAQIEEIVADYFS